MDASPSKRRKVTPDLGVAVNASNTDIEPAARDARAFTPGRASFMSPTKSSLARYNPSLLPRPKSAGGSGDGGKETGFDDGGRQSGSSPRRLNAVPLRPTTPNERPPRLSASPIRLRSASPRRMSAIGGSLSSPARRRSHTPGRRSEPPVLPTARRLSPPLLAPITVAEAGADAPNSQLSQELEASAAEVAEEDSRANGATGGGVDEDGEPELPPTPEHLGLKPLPSPPKGLMSSSPSARKSKRKGYKSSPLKPRAAARQRTDDGPSTQVVEETSQEQSTEAMDEVVEEKPEETERKRKLEELTKQLTAIQADEAVLSAAVVAAQKQNGTFEDPSQLISIITSSNPTHKPLPPPPKPLPLSTKLSFFLPFAKRRPPRKQTPHGPEKPLPSYAPVEVEEPLSELQAFHPLTVVSSEKIIESSLHNGPLLRQQDLTMTSPASLLTAHLRVTINTEQDSVDGLFLESLSPWAQQELGAWIQTQTRNGDVSSVGWACGRYWDISLTRARVWAHCYEKYSHLVSDTTIGGRHPLHEKTAQALPDPRTQTAGSKHPYADEFDSTIKMTRSDLRTHLGKQTLRMSRDGASIVFKWEIGFDWTGEVESKVGAETAFPGTWKEADERKSLRKVGKVFQRLVKERGLGDAIRIVVGVVWPG